MSKKRVIGVIVLILGVIMLLFANNAKARIAEAKETGSNLEGTHNPIGKMVGGAISDKAGSYDTLVQIIFIGGIALIVIGGYFVIFGRRKK